MIKINFLCASEQNIISPRQCVMLGLNKYGQESRKEIFCLFNDALNTYYFTVIWRRTYGKWPLR